MSRLKHLKGERGKLLAEVRRLEGQLADPSMKVLVGVYRYQEWREQTGSHLADLHLKVGTLNSQIRKEEKARARRRQEAMEARRAKIEAQGDPLLVLLDDAFALFRTLQNEGVEFGEDETALIDVIGVELKERAGGSDDDS